MEPVKGNQTAFWDIGWSACGENKYRIQLSLERDIATARGDLPVLVSVPFRCVGTRIVRRLEVVKCVG